MKNLNFHNCFNITFYGHVRQSNEKEIKASLAIAMASSHESSSPMSERERVFFTAFLSCWEPQIYESLDWKFMCIFRAGRSVEGFSDSFFLYLNGGFVNYCFEALITWMWRETRNEISINISYFYDIFRYFVSDLSLCHVKAVRLYAWYYKGSICENLRKKRKKRKNRTIFINQFHVNPTCSILFYSPNNVVCGHCWISDKSFRDLYI